MFIGRERELASLNQLYQSDKFEFAVLYGRRRIGKTALLNEFIRDKQAIYFTGVETNEKQNLENFSLCILNLNTSFPSFQDALEHVFIMSQKEKIILIIDEYPYVAKSSRSLASTLQLLIDRYKSTSHMFLILCGSSMSYMEDQVLAYKSPLYGRRTAQFKIQPFDFFECCSFFEKFSMEEKALIYGIIGGTPQYLLFMDDSLSIEQNIKNTFLNPMSSIYEEPTNLLKQEMREPAIYNAIISAIAGGASKITEISGKVGENTSTCSNYIKNLISLGIVYKEMPYGEKNCRKTIYSIADNMFRFWYRFVPSNNSMIVRGAADLTYKKIEPQLSHYMGNVFEEICKQYLWRRLLNGNSEVDFIDIGRWWGTDSHTRKQVEIDIMGSDGKDCALFAECKWTNEKVNLPVLKSLMEKATLFHFPEKHYYLFSKNGFTDGCREEADKYENVKLVCYADFFE